MRIAYMPETFPQEPNVGREKAPLVYNLGS